MAKAITEPGPFTSLFDYEEEQKALEARKKRQVEAQHKIQRTNAIGDAFRLLFDAVGGSKGATITPKGVNPGIMRASERLQSLNKDYDDKADRLRIQNHGAKEKDLQVKLGLEAEGRKNKREDQLLADKYLREDKAQDKQMAHQKEMAGISGKNAMNIETARHRGDMEEIAKRTEGELKEIQERAARKNTLAQKGLFEVSRYDNPSIDTIVSRNQVLSLLPQLKQHLLDQGVFPTQMPRVLQIAEVKGKISDDDLKYLIGAYRDFFQPRLPELTGGTPNAEAYKEPNDSDIITKWWSVMGKQNPLGPVVTNPTPQKPAYTKIAPDKTGVTDLSVFFN